MRTLILIPTETEAAPLRAACPDAPVRIAGVGMAAAAAATARIIAEEHPDRLILAGIAGASDRSVAVCEVVAVAGERIAELPGKYAVRYAADFIPAGLRTVESNTTNRTGVAASGTQIENMDGRSRFPGRLPGIRSARRRGAGRVELYRRPAFGLAHRGKCRKISKNNHSNTFGL